MIKMITIAPERFLHLPLGCNITKSIKKILPEVDGRITFIKINPDEKFELPYIKEVLDRPIAIPYAGGREFSAYKFNDKWVYFDCPVDLTDKEKIEAMNNDDRCKVYDNPEFRYMILD